MTPRLLPALALLTATALTPAATARSLGSVKSPDGLSLLQLNDDNGTLTYTLQRNGRILSSGSTLGLTTAAVDFNSGISCTATASAAIDTEFGMPLLSPTPLTDRCNELNLELTKGGAKLTVRIRLYDEGMAWRYELPGTGSATITDEGGVCRLTDMQGAVALPLSKGGRNSFTEQSDTLLRCLGRANLPLQPLTADGAALQLCETAAGDYCGSHLTVEADGGLRFVPNEEVSVSLPFATPWRMLMYGDARQRMSSSMAYALSAPSRVSDCSWIKPGYAASAYAGQDHAASHLDAATIRSYIDWAAEQGWNYFTLDRSWQRYNVNLKDITAYAAARGVGVIAWLSSSGLPATAAAMRTRLSQLKSFGILGIKIDYFEDCSLAANRSRELLLQVAAEQQLMVVLGSQANAAGLARTWPHIVGVETGLTNASTAFTPDLLTAAHNITAAIVHTASAPVDYTPVDLAERSGKLLQQVTHAHQLALGVVFNSPVTHISDAPDNLKSNIARQLLRTLPHGPQPVQVLDAEPGSYVAVRRGSGPDYVIGALTAEARTAEFTLDFLPAGRTVNAYIYRDGSCPTDLRFEYRRGLTAESVLRVPMLRSGGVTVRLSESDSEVKPYSAVYEAESADNDNPFGTAVVEDPDSLCSGAAYLLGAGNGKNISFKNINVPKPGTYALTVYYMSSAAVKGFVRTNGSLLSLRSVDYIATGGREPHSMAQLTLPVTFDRCEGNTVELGASSLMPAIDRIAVTDNTSTDYYDALPELPVADTAAPVAIFAEDGGVGIESAAGLPYTVTTPAGLIIATGHTAQGRTHIPVATRGIVIATAGPTATKLIF